MSARNLRSSLGHFCRNNSKRWISSSQLTIEKTKDAARFENRPKKEDLVFGTTMSDHMLMIEWESANGWGAPRIVPYQNLSLSPAATSLHYGLQCFEGMKAYKSLSDDSLRLFRPNKNMERLSNSMERLHMPGADFDRAEFANCIAELVRVDQDWIPSGEGYSLYIRPTCIATHPFLGLVSSMHRYHAVGAFFMSHGNWWMDTLFKSVVGLTEQSPDVCHNKPSWSVLQKWFQPSQTYCRY